MVTSAQAYWLNRKRRQKRAASEGVGGYTFVNAEAAALVARFTTPPTDARKLLIDNLVGSLKTAGVWSKLDCLYLTAAADAQAARRNWIADQYNLTAVSGPTFTADRGYAGDGSGAYLDTNFNPVTATTPKFAQNDAHGSAWNRTSRAAGDISLFGSVNGTTSAFNLQSRFTGDVAVAFVNDWVPQMSAANANSSGDYAIDRTASNARRLLKGGASITSNSQASTGVPSANILILARSRQGSTPQTFAADQVAFAAFGGSLTVAEEAARFAAVQTYLQAVGAA